MRVEISSIKLTHILIYGNELALRVSVLNRTKMYVNKLSIDFEKLIYVVLNYF